MTTPPSTSKDSTQSDAIDLDRLLDELALSGLSTAAFARERRIAPWRLYNALRRRSGKATRRSRKASRDAFLPVRLKDLDSTPRSRATLELVLSPGYRLLLSADFDEAAVRRLLCVLRTC